MVTPSLSRRDLITSALVLALAGVFFVFFQLSKQVPALAAVNASNVDPYDAIGSFGIQAAALFAALSALRAFLWGRAGALSPERGALLARTRIAVVLAVAVTLAGDVVAMVRHSATWLGVPLGAGYAAALVAVALMAALVGARVLRSASGTGRPPASDTQAARARALAAAAVFVVVLAVYPAGVTESIPGALLTVLAGVVLLFVPMRLFTLALVPAAPADAPAPAPRPGARGRQWALVAGLGVLVGLALVAAELLVDAGGAPAPLSRIALVVSVYVGLETSGLLIGYALLRGPLGLERRWRMLATADDTRDEG